jgi:cytochrome b
MNDNRYHDMTSPPNISKTNDLDVFTRIIHLGMMIFGVLAWIAGDWAEDYEHVKHLGYIVHSWLGMGLTLFVSLRLIYGLTGPKAIRFSHWVPYTKSRLIFVWEDIQTLLRFRLPDRPAHQGLAGLVQTFGLLTFSWMALTGSLMFFYLKPGIETVGIMHYIEEMHEIGEGLILLFLGLHVGAVTLHALAGHHLWRKMIFLKE